MDKNTVLGKALYLEFRRENYTLQMVLLPDSIDETGNYTPVTLMRRQISSYHPRKSWRFDKPSYSLVPELKGIAVDMENKPLVLDVDTAKVVAKTHLQFVKPLLSQLHHQGWTLQKQPVAVEFSHEDRTLVEGKNTPQGLVRRILRSREAFGFDKELFATV